MVLAPQGLVVYDISLKTWRRLMVRDEPKHTINDMRFPKCRITKARVRSIRKNGVKITWLGIDQIILHDLFIGLFLSLREG